MSRAERNKGAAGEREVAEVFRAYGFDCDRVPNSGGLKIKGDLYGTVPAHVEVKRQELARPWLWWEQATREAAEGVPPIVAFRRSRSPWLAIVSLDFLAGVLADAGAAREVTRETVRLLDRAERSAAKPTPRRKQGTR